MLRLCAFGTATLERDGARLQGLSAQRKAMALLVLLASAGDAGVSRDRVIATLWAESDEAHARGALKQLTHAVRHQLGIPDLFTGTADLSLNRERISSDVADFRAAIRAGEGERAVALYRGPFLDGFHLRDAAEFDRWADRERAGFAASFAHAMEQLADAAAQAGDHVGAARWWSQLAASDPLDARATVRLMSALVSAGDQAAALRQARTYDALVREQHDGAPDPRVAMMADTLESGLPVTGTFAPVVRPVPAAPPAAPTPAELTAAIPMLPAVSLVARYLPARAARRVLTGLIGLLVLIVLAGVEDRLRSKGRTSTTVTAPAFAAAGVPAAKAVRPSVGVVPFANIGGRADDEPFADGLTDELIGALGRVAGLKVAGRTSAFALKGRSLSVRAIADTLRVAAVLEGSVRRTGDHVRVTATLVAAAADSVLWSETFDRRSGDIFALQEDIAQAIVRALKVSFDSAAPTVRHATRDALAYDFYLRGRYFSARQNRPSLLRAVSYLEQAIARDSGFAAAYASLADARILLVLFGGHQPRDELPRARAAAQHALALDSTLGEAHGALAHVLFAFDWNWLAAGREFERAIALDPGLATLRQRYGIYLLDLGEFDRAATVLHDALAIDPLSAPITMTLGRVFVNARQPERAQAALLTAIELNPALSFAHLQLGHAYLQQGNGSQALVEFRTAAALSGVSDSAQLAYAYAVSNRRGDALTVLRQLLASAPRRYLPPFSIAMAYTGLGLRDSAFRWLDRGVAERAAYMDMVGVIPAFDPLRTDPRFTALLQRMNLGRTSAVRARHFVAAPR